MNSYKLEGKTAVITGGSSGIGKAIALRFAKEGAKVIITARKEKELEETASLHKNIVYVAGDITKSETIDRIIEKINSEFLGQLDILVNNAGWCPVQPITDVTIEDYDKAFDVDVRSVVALTVKALPLIINSKGNILNMSSVSATHRGPFVSMYQGAKAAIENFTKTWALELADKGVRVNAIAPGAIRTNIWNVTDLTEEEARKHEEMVASNIPMKRFGDPEEIASAATYLVSDEAGYITGSVMAVDGGMGAI